MRKPGGVVLEKTALLFCKNFVENRAVKFLKFHEIVINQVGRPEKKIIFVAVLYLNTSLIFRVIIVITPE